MITYENEIEGILDETAEFAAQHIVATPAQIDGKILYAAATHALQAFPAFGRALWTATQEASGKTVSMSVTAALSANPRSAKGTQYALRAALARASNEPEADMPTFYYDEIQRVYGTAGLNSGGATTLTALIGDGYKKGATDSWSVNRSDQEFSIYAPFLMTGLQTAVPRDIRSRCIVFRMEPGTPRRYFDARESEPQAAGLRKALSCAVKEQFEELAAFRARGLHPRLVRRRLEVWEPLLAVAWVLGGQPWLNRALAAFTELAIDGSRTVLSPHQQVIRDAALLVDSAFAGKDFIGGLELADDMARIENPLYATRTPTGMARLIAEAMPVQPRQVRFGTDRIRGYLASDIRRAWEAIRPPEDDDPELQEDENPFDVTEESDEQISECVAPIRKSA